MNDFKCILTEYDNEIKMFITEHHILITDSFTLLFSRGVIIVKTNEE